MKKPIPLVDLTFQYNSIKEDIDSKIFKIIQGGYFSEWPEVPDFEIKFANKNQSTHCIALNSGTSALHAILKELKVGADHEVILPANTCFPTAEAVCMTGANPVFVDCDPEFYNIDPDQIESVITSKTKAIIVVHLYGQPAQLEKIKKIADQFKLYLIEDCAQAHMARYQGRLVGNIGKAGAFSFYPTKNLGAYGESGAVVTNDSNLADRIRAFKNHGSVQKNVHEFVGHNYRMDNLQAAILSVKLKYIAQWTKQRQANARLYYRYLSEVSAIVLPKQLPGAIHVFHQFVIRTNRRKGLKEYLAETGIETAIHYPIPCHLQPALQHLGFKEGSFPVCEKLATEILSLPVAGHINSNAVKYICDRIKWFFKNND